MDAGWVLDASRPAISHDTDKGNVMKRIAAVNKSAISRT